MQEVVEQDDGPASNEGIWAVVAVRIKRRVDLQKSRF